jgi:hypothetical protein
MSIIYGSGFRFLIWRYGDFEPKPSTRAIIGAMRKASRPRTGRSLAELLAAQSEPLRRRPEFAALERLVRESASLRRARIPGVAYRLLDEPRLELRFIGDFLNTYRLPESAFFSRFLALKWERRAELEAARARRLAAIRDIARTFPSWARDFLEYLRATESERDPHAPIWRASVFPRSKRSALAMSRFGVEEWRSYLAERIELLREGYRRIALPSSDILLDCALLGLFPDPTSGALPSETALRSRFRSLSKMNHPDSGGDAKKFRILKEARDRLLEASLGNPTSRRRG